MNHADHWAAIFPEGTNLFERVVRRLVPEGREIGRAPCVLADEDRIPRPKTAHVLEWPETPLRYLAICVAAGTDHQAEIEAFYPFCVDGEPRRLRIEDFGFDQGDPVEGWVTLCAEDEEWAVRFSDPLFILRYHEYRRGEEYPFLLSGLALTLSKAEERVFVIERGPLVELQRRMAVEKDPSIDPTTIRSAELRMAADARSLLPTPDEPQWSTFRGPVLDVADCDVAGVPFLRLRTEVIGGVDRSLVLAIFVAVDRLGGYRPQTGEGIEGLVWLQGHVSKEGLQAGRDLA